MGVDMYSIYNVYVDYGNGGHHELVNAFENKNEAVEYARRLITEIQRSNYEFHPINNTEDGCFFFKRDTIVGIRVVPDTSGDDNDDDDDDEGEADEPKNPVVPDTIDELIGS